MEHFLDALQPYIGTIVEAIVGILALLVIAALTQLRVRVNEWLEARTTAAQREVLHRIAEEAYAFVEKQLKDAGGEEKLRAAVEHVLQRINADKLGIDYADIQAAVQKAWQTLDKKAKA